jgi:protein-arginine kinase activator protein McsA
MNKVVKTHICSKCGSEHPLTEEFFGRNQSTNTGGNKYFRPECKKCTKKAGQGRSQAYKLADKPSCPELGTPCYNCGRTDKKLVFDHDHETLKHRGWLCDNCNRSIGMLGDTIESLERAIKYLKEGNLHA